MVDAFAGLLWPVTALFLLLKKLSNRNYYPNPDTTGVKRVGVGFVIFSTNKMVHRSICFFRCGARPLLFPSQAVTHDISREDNIMGSRA